MSLPLKHGHREMFIQDPTWFLNAGFYNLLTTSIPSIIQSSAIAISTVFEDLRYRVLFSEVCVYNEGIHLSECFQHNLTYRVPVTVKMTCDVLPLILAGKKEPEVLSTIRTPLFYIPIPTGPSLLRCAALEDPDIRCQTIESGIFVIDGSMHTCPGTKAMKNNTFLNIENSNATATIQIRSSHEGNRTIENGNPFRPTSSIEFLVHQNNRRSVIENNSSVGIVCQLPFSKKKIKIGVMAQAFGCDPIRFVQLIRCVAGLDYEESIFRCYEIDIIHYTPNFNNQDQALMELAKPDDKNRRSTGINLLKTEIFPHLNVMYEKGDQRELYVLKLYYLAIVATMSILFASGKIKQKSRDLWEFTNIVLPWQQIGALIKKKLQDHASASVKLFRRALHTIFKKPVEKQDFISLKKWWGEDRLSDRISGPIASGNFSPHGKYSHAKQGITMPLPADTNPAGVTNQLQRTSASMRRTDSINTNPRKLPKDSPGYPCGGFTPEGHMVGLVTSWACTSRLTNEVEDPLSLVELIEMTFADYLIRILDIILPPESDHCQASSEEKEEPESELKMGSAAMQLIDKMRFGTVDPSWYIFFNNCGVPTHFIKAEKVKEFVAEFRKLRRMDCIPRHCFLRITHTPRHIQLYCEGGQVVRPLIVLDNIRKLRKGMSFYQLIHSGVVEYVNVTEEQTLCRVVLSMDDLRYACSKNEHHELTHMEFDPAAFFGLIGASIVFATCQPGPRTAYAIHQWKQIICAGTKPYRGNILSAELVYNCAKIVHTRVSGLLATERDGYGQLVFNASLTDPKDQEDAFFMHKQAVDRGLFLALTTRYYSSEIRAPTLKTSERFEKPQHVFSKKEDFSYDAIDEKTGLPINNYYIRGGHPICAKTCIVKRPNTKGMKQHASDAENKNNSEIVDDELKTDDLEFPSKIAKTAKKGTPRHTIWRREIGTCTAPDESGIISNVQLFPTRDGVGLRTSVVTSRPMEHGNKSTNDGANKGTNSENRSSKDMYWEETTGMIYDLISAPTALISRNLMSTVHEGHIGYAAILSGDLKFAVDQQMYDGKMREKLKEAAEIRVRAGKKRSGGAFLRCGRTGKRLKSEVAEMVIYYKPLLHLAEKKLQFRALGPRHTQTRQPLTGRSKKGGIRFGEHESAATTAQGAEAALRERLCDCSDVFEIFVCSQCHNLAFGNKFVRFRWCPTCQRRDTVYLVKVTFIFLYNLYERAAMGNKTQIIIRPHSSVVTDVDEQHIPSASLVS